MSSAAVDAVDQLGTDVFSQVLPVRLSGSYFGNAFLFEHFEIRFNAQTSVFLSFLSPLDLSSYFTALPA